MHSNKSICLKVLKEQTNAIETIHAYVHAFIMCAWTQFPTNMTPI